MGGGFGRLSPTLKEYADRVMMFDPSAKHVAVAGRLLAGHPTLREIVRVLKPGGSALIEVADSAHMLNKLHSARRLRGIPRGPVDIRSAEKAAEGGIPFVNHHPDTVVGQFTEAGLRVEDKLSVSNMRTSGPACSSRCGGAGSTRAGAQGAGTPELPSAPPRVNVAAPDGGRRGRHALGSPAGSAKVVFVNSPRSAKSVPAKLTRSAKNVPLKNVSPAKTAWSKETGPSKRT